MSDVENDADTGQEAGRKIKREERTSIASQTDDEPSDVGDTPQNNMAEAIEDMNRKLDLALTRLFEIDEIKERQKLLEKENADLKESLEFAHTTIATLTKRVDNQDKMLSKHTEGVNELTKTCQLEKEAL